MAKRRGSKIFLGLLLILAIIFGGAFFILRTTKNVAVTWTDADYQSYVNKLQRKSPVTGDFNLINLSRYSITCNGKKNLDVSLTNSEVSSALSKENEKFGPIKDVKIRFIGGNEGEATFRLTENFTKYVALDSYDIANNNLVKSAINGTPIYIRVKVDKGSEKSIIADFKNISIGRIPLSASTVQKVETEAVRMVNNIMKKYDNFIIDDLSFDEGKLNFKGTIPTEVNVQK